jgi:hypothetical protein
MPACIGHRSREPAQESGRRAREPTIPKSIDPSLSRSGKPKSIDRELLRSIRPKQARDTDNRCFQDAYFEAEDALASRVLCEDGSTLAALGSESRQIVKVPGR